MQFSLRSFLFIISFTTLNASAGLRCDLITSLEHPNVASNEKFWAEYTSLSSQNKLNDRSLEDLLKKHDALPTHSGKTESFVNSSKPYNFSTTKKADKDLKILPKNLRGKYEEFLSIMSDKSGLKKLYENPGKWHLEKLQAHKDLHTVRLNNGVRVEFRLDGDNLEIIQVNRSDIHSL